MSGSGGAFSALGKSPKVHRNKITSGKGGAGLGWRKVSIGLILQGRCNNRMCDFFWEKIAKERWEEPSCFVVLNTPSPREFFPKKGFSREGLEGLRVFKGDFLAMLNPQDRESEVNCPGCKKKFGEVDGPELASIGCRGYRFRCTFQVRSGGRVKEYHYPACADASDENIFYGAGPMEFFALSAESMPFRDFANIVKFEVEMRDWPIGFTVNGLCTNSHCGLKKGLEELQGSADAIFSYRSLGVGFFTIEHKAGDLVVYKDGRLADLSCEACRAPLSGINSIGLIRCVCQLTTPQKKHPKFYSCTGSNLQEVRIPVAALARHQPDIFPLEVFCELMWPGVTVRGPCTRGDDCPLQDKQLKELLEGSLEEEGIFFGYTKVFKPQTCKQMRDNLMAKNLVVFHSCKACEDSGKFRDDSQVKATSLSIYNCNYRMSFMEKNSTRRVRLPEKEGYYYIADGHILQNLDEFNCKLFSFEVSVELLE